MSQFRPTFWLLFCSVGAKGLVMPISPWVPPIMNWNSVGPAARRPKRETRTTGSPPRKAMSARFSLCRPEMQSEGHSMPGWGCSEENVLMLSSGSSLATMSDALNTAAAAKGAGESRH